MTPAAASALTTQSEPIDPFASLKTGWQTVDHMRVSSLQPTITSFTGAVDLSGQAVPVQLSFTDRSASLVVGGEEIGTWELDDVEFEDTGTDGFVISAEGDAIVFTPDQPDTFRRHLGEPAHDSSSRPADTGDEGIEEEGVSFDVPERQHLDALFPGTSSDDPLPDEDGPFADDPFTDDAHSDDAPDVGAGPLDSLSFDEPEDDGRPLIEPEDRADEYFAAGVLPPTESGHIDRAPIPDQSAMTLEPSEATVAVDGEEAVEEDPADHGQTDPTHRVSSEGPDEAQERLENPSTAAADSAESLVATSPGEESPSDAEQAPSISELSIAGRPIPVEPSVARDDEAGAEAGGDAPTGLSRLGRFARRRRTDTTGEAPDPPSNDDPWARAASNQNGDNDIDDTPAGRISLAKRLAGADPTSDAENLRQWVLVAGGGVMGLVLIGGIAWGVITLLGGEDPAGAAEPVPTTEAPATTAPTTTAPPPSTTSGDTSGVATPTSVAAVPDASAAADAATFVSAWNQLATKYAYGLAIGDGPDTLPVSASVSETIAIRYGADRVLTLSAAPQGDGADRDILVAMGMAVAWADPSIPPEGRADLLGSLGVDVDDPQITDMGGTISRGSVTYELQIVDGLIRFTVGPAA